MSEPRAHLQQTVRVSVKVRVPGTGGVFGVAAHPPAGGVDLKCVPVKLPSLVEAHVELMSVAPCACPFVLQPAASYTDTLPPVQAAGAPHAQPRHAFDSSALVPAVLRFGNPRGQASVPSFVMQLSKPLPLAGTQASSAPQVPAGGASQRRPSVTALVRPAFAVQVVGEGRTAFAKAPFGTMIGLPSAVHALTSTGIRAVAGATPQVASVVSVRVKSSVPQPPLASPHVHEQVGVPSPFASRRSFGVAEAGHGGRDAAATLTGVQPAGTD